MPRKRRKQGSAASVATADLAARAAVWALALTIFATLALVDVRAEGSFDAPKRFALVAGVSVAALLAAFSRSVTWPRPRRDGIVVALCAGTAIVFALISAIASPQRAVGLDSLGIGAAIVASIWLASSSLLDAVWDRLLTSFVAGAVLNSVVAIFQRGGVGLFQQEQVGGRSAASALIGNDGQLALIVAFALLIVIVRIFTTKRRAWLIAAAIPLVLVVISYRSLTALLVLAAAAVVLSIRLTTGRARIAIAAAALVLIVVGAVVPLIHFRTANGLDAASLDRALSYRFGPWAAAAEMIRERPLVGFGPGTFESQFMAHRFEAERRWHRRLQNPFNASGGYGEGHDDYLQSGAETGVISPLAIAVGAVLLIVSLFRTADRDDRERLTLLVVLVGLAVAAFSWFPLRMSSTLLVASLCAGRAWRLGADDGADEGGGAFRWITAAIAVVLFVAVLPGEMRRYSAERKLYRATGIAMAVASGQAPPGAAGYVRQAAETAEELEGSLPGDHRPPMLRASARLLLGEKAEAKDAFRDALKAGERAEVDLNLARVVEGDAAVRAAYLRAAWISDAIIPSIPPQVRDSIRSDVASRERQLEKGEAWAIPPAVTP